MWDCSGCLGRDGCGVSIGVGVGSGPVPHFLWPLGPPCPSPPLFVKGGADSFLTSLSPLSLSLCTPSLFLHLVCACIPSTSYPPPSYMFGWGCCFKIVLAVCFLGELRSPAILGELRSPTLIVLGELCSPECPQGHLFWQGSFAPLPIYAS